jgi:hypothetical protein
MDKVDAMGKKKLDEHMERVLNRPFHYGYSMAGSTIYAYTKEEWGIGAGSGGGDHNLIRSFYFSISQLVISAPVSLAALTFGIVTLSSPVPIMALFMLLFAALFGLSFIRSVLNIRQEWQGRKARKLSGLPKPWLTAEDHEAYEWFLQHPDPRIPMTLDYFPYSVKLRKAAEQHHAAAIRGAPSPGSKQSQTVGARSSLSAGPESGQASEPAAQGPKPCQ